MELSGVCHSEDAPTGRARVVSASNQSAAALTLTSRTASSDALPGAKDRILARVVYLRAPGRIAGRIAKTVSFRPRVGGLVAVALLGGAVVACCVVSSERARTELDNEPAQPNRAAVVNTVNFSTAGKGTYFNLEPGYRLCYRDGALTRTMTVRRKTKLVAGVQTRVVEEKEEKDGQTTKVLWKYYAIDKATSAVYCFGVHVRSYHNGELVGHSGWCAGVNGAVFSLAVPASPKPGDTLPRGSAQQACQVIETKAKVKTPAGTFTNCLRTRATESGDGGVREKVFAPGVGPVKNGPFALVKIVKTVPKTTVEASDD